MHKYFFKKLLSTTWKKLVGAAEKMRTTFACLPAGRDSDQQGRFVGGDYSGMTDSSGMANWFELK